jgi:DNA-binding NtrC family response regulator
MKSRVALLLCKDEEVHDLAECWLRTAGLNVISALDERCLQAILFQKSVDFLILDRLPLYGTELPSLRSLKKESPGLRILLIPSLAEHPELGIARISGVDAVLSRPMRRAALLSALN